MKKILLYIFALICLVFLIPFVLTIKFSTTDTVSYVEPKNNTQVLDKTQYDYKEYSTINVLNTETNEVSEVSLDEYLLGVVSAEMPANYHIEALKAQAVVARTYTLYTITHNSAKHGIGTICTSSSCCQAWLSKEDRISKWPVEEQEQNWSKIEEAVYKTKGQVIEYNGQVIDAFFHSNSGGKTEVPVNVWGGTDFPYLKVVETAGEDAYTQYSSEVQLTKDDFSKKMKEKYSDFQINWEDAECIKITEYTDSGRVRYIKVGNKNLSGVEARSLFGLKSANFECELEGNKVKFSVTGYGHGVGMSQTGADSMAKSGSNYEEIIKHFYSGIEIVNM